MDLGERIKVARLGKGMTQNELAEATGISLRTIQRLEKGEVNASIYSRNQLEKVLPVSLKKSSNSPEEKINHLSITLNLFDIKQLVEDLKMVFKRNWKWMIGILLIIWFSNNYPEIKAGLMDGWMDG